MDFNFGCNFRSSNQNEAKAGNVFDSDKIDEIHFFC